MKILFISQVFPYPLDTGSRNHIYHWLKAVGQEHSIDLMVVEPSSELRLSLPGLSNVKVATFGKVPSRTYASRVLRMVQSIVEGIPGTALVGMPSAAKAYIREILKTRPYDVVILCEGGSGIYAPMLEGTMPTILLKHSVQAIDAMQESRRRGPINPRGFLQVWIVNRFEARTCRAAAVVCTVNSEDAAELNRIHNLEKSPIVIPVGVDLDAFPRRSSMPQTNIIGFFGNLTWGANIDAAQWFAKKVMPKVTCSHPDAMFRVIGLGSDELRKTLSSPHLEFTGRVPSIPEAMEDVAIGVVPVVTGTGIRFKLLEMLSMGIPTVTTSLGKLGTSCVHGTHVLVADNPDDFASAVNMLLSDSNLRDKLSREASKIATEYSWEAILGKIRKSVNDVISGSKRKAPLGPR